MATIMWHYNDVLMLSMPLGESQDSLAGRFICSRNFANECHGDGAKKTALESCFLWHMRPATHPFSYLKS
jgi:hypothetical protein